MIITTEKGGKFTKGGKAILPTVYGFEEIAEKDLFSVGEDPSLPRFSRI